jgi:hypothetical protein
MQREAALDGAGGALDSAVRVRREGREWVPAYLMLTGSGSESLIC